MIWFALKFVVGLGIGLFLGCLLAALAAPAAGEDTRQRLKGMVPIGGQGDRDASIAMGAAGRSANGGGPLEALKARFRHAMDAARRERDLRERELLAEFETAKKTGSAP